LVGGFGYLGKNFENQLGSLSRNSLDALVDGYLTKLVVGFGTEIPEIGKCAFVDLKVVLWQSLRASATSWSASTWPTAVAATRLRSGLGSQLRFLLLVSGSIG
jgi:hypothetical protein